MEQCLQQFLLRHNYVHCQGLEICEDCNLKVDYTYIPGTVISMCEIAGYGDIPLSGRLLVSSIVNTDLKC